MRKLNGIIPALLTPFRADDRINKPALRQLVKMNIDKGVAGFYCCGSTAEAFLLTTNERKEVLETVMEEANGRCAVIAHIGSICQKDAIELAKHAESVGVDAISSIPPFYYKFSFQEIKDFYFGIVDEVSVPMIIYNFPASSGVTFNKENIGQFLCDDRFIGIKHTSGDFYALNRFKRAYPDKLVFNGSDEVFLSGLAMGADGGIGSTYNFMAEKFLEIQKLFEAGQIEEARAVQARADDIIDILIAVGVMPGEKEILNLMGLDFGACRKPFKGISDDERKLLAKVVNEML